MIMSATGPEKSSTPAQAATPAPAPAAPVYPPPPGPDLLERSTIPFQAVDFALKGFHLDATVSAEQVVPAATELDREGFALDTITGVDWLAEAKMEVVYDYFHPLTGLRVVVRSRILRENPEIPTISSIFPGANWHERETHDFFGVHFSGHPNLEPFLLPEDATYHPLRKDFTA
jgi:NADH-quinone oxidoreductase subunit C